MIENQYRDPAEYNEASYTPDLAAELDTTADYLAETFQDLHLPRSTIERLANWHEERIEAAQEKAQSLSLLAVISMFLSPGNLSLRAWALAFAAGLDAAAGRSMTDVAEELGCTRAAISKETGRWTDLLGLSRSRYQKSEAAREAYSKVQKQNHWRHAA